MSDATTHDQQALWSQVARERDRLTVPQLVPLWNAMLDTIDVRAGVRFLDAGCGSGGATEIALQRGATVDSVDLSREMIALCHEKPQLAKATIQVASVDALPFADASFDAAMASMVIHFCPDPAKALRELARVLKPSGRLAISAPSSADLDIVIVFHVAAELQPAAAADILRPLTFAPPHKLVAAFEAAGLHNITEEIVDTPVGPMTFEAQWARTKTWAPIAATVAAVGEQRFLDAYVPRLAHCGSHDNMTLSSKYRVVSATR